MATNQYTMQDPTTQYPQPKFDEQSQPVPSLAENMTPEPVPADWRVPDRIVVSTVTAAGEHQR